MKLALALEINIVFYGCHVTNFPMLNLICAKMLIIMIYRYICICKMHSLHWDLKVHLSFAYLPLEKKAWGCPQGAPELRGRVRSSEAPSQHLWGIPWLHINYMRWGQRLSTELTQVLAKCWKDVASPESPLACSGGIIVLAMAGAYKVLLFPSFTEITAYVHMWVYLSLTWSDFTMHALCAESLLASATNRRTTVNSDTLPSHEWGPVCGQEAVWGIGAVTFSLSHASLDGGWTA